MVCFPTNLDALNAIYASCCLCLDCPVQTYKPLPHNDDF